jgi:uncharacterized phage protein (TIGR01671 family)
MREMNFRCWKDGEMHEDGESKFWLSQGFDYLYMQFTGLKDKNGKEIYEGDIIDFEEPVYESQNLKCPVVFYECEFVADWDRGDAQTYIPLRDMNDVEVIGNIYENPELLK